MYGEERSTAAFGSVWIIFQMFAATLYDLHIVIYGVCLTCDFDDFERECVS